VSKRHTSTLSAMVKTMNNETEVGDVPNVAWEEKLFAGIAKLMLCLAVAKNALSNDETIVAAINKAAKYTVFEPTPRQMESLKVYQNNEHHMEGWLYNHYILMLYALRHFGRSLPESAYRTLELSIFWSDLGKLDTKKDSPKKVWEDGTPQSTTFGHDKKSAEMHEEAHPEARMVNYLVAEHMNAHNTEEQFEKVKKLAGYEWLNPQLNDLLNSDGLMPEWDTIAWPHGKNLSKKQYAWVCRAHNPLLYIKQQCDDAGRISELAF